MKVVVVGGGISGMAAAFELSSDPDLEIVLHEAKPYLGGKIQSSEFVGREVEGLRDDPAAIERAAREELGFVKPGEIVIHLQ